MPNTLSNEPSGELLPRLTFDSADYPPGLAFARWSALTAGYDVILPEGETIDTFAVRNSAWMVGEAVVSQGRVTPIQLARLEEQACIDGIDSYLFALITDGLWSGTFAGRQADIAPGQVCIIDFAEPWTTLSTVTEFTFVRITRNALSVQLPGIADLHGRVLDGAAGRLAAEHMVALAAQLHTALSSDAPLLERVTVQLLASCLERLPPRDASDPHHRGIDPVRRRVTHYIERKLEARDLTPAALCRDLGLSRPALYRAMQAQGGVTAYIQRRRLETVHILLSNPSETRGIAAIAEAYGFSSHSQFSTAFKRQFGYAPQEARSRSDLHAHGSAALRFRSWSEDMAVEAGPTSGP